MENVYREEDYMFTCPECECEVDEDGYGFACCGYAPVQCDTCGYATCDQSC